MPVKRVLQSNGAPLTRTQQAERMMTVLRQLTGNAVMSRSQLLTWLSDELHDINKECGYPETINIGNYKEYFEREGIATRVVSFMSEECWTVPPEIYEVEDVDTETEFETASKQLIKDFNLFELMLRFDIVSGIGHYGTMLIGIDDGLPLDQPVQGIDLRTGEKTGSQQYEPMYFVPFDEAECVVARWETDQNSKRFGKPEAYTVKFFDPSNYRGAASAGVPSIKDMTVHWTRLVHLADNCLGNDVYGQPRMKNVFNRLIDIRKLLGGSAEMFWKGAFPGYSFEVPPQIAAEIELDEDTILAMKDQAEKYFAGLQRYFALSGMTAKSLATQIADPEVHFDTQITAICITKGFPKRQFMGSEQGQLASSQDKDNWLRRLGRRNELHTTPRVVRPVIDRLQMFGSLPEAEYEVNWPDLNTLSDSEKASVMAQKAHAIAEYVTSGSAQLIGPLEFLVHVLEMGPDEAESVLEAASELIQDSREMGLAKDPEKEHEKDLARIDATARAKQMGPLPDQVQNAFCPTGEGGGVDPTCSPDGSGGRQ